jgi:cell wall-associated NlpC family hydrolase
MSEFCSDYAGLDKKIYFKKNAKGLAYGSEYFTPTMPTEAASRAFKVVKRGTTFQHVTEMTGGAVKHVAKKGLKGAKKAGKRIGSMTEGATKYLIEKEGADSFGGDGSAKAIRAETAIENGVKRGAKTVKRHIEVRDAKAVKYSAREMDNEYRKALANGDFKTFENRFKSVDKRFNVSKTVRKTGPADSHEAYRAFHKKATQKKFSRRIYKQRHTAVYNTQQKIKAGAKNLASKAGSILKSAVAELAKRPHLVIIGIALFALIMVSNMVLDFFSVMFASGETSGLGTTYLAEDSEILACEDYYKGREDELKEWVDKIEVNYPGFDEYDYSDVASIEHNPYAIATYLSALLHSPFTAGEVTGYEDTFFTTQYHWYTTETWEEREEPEYDEYDGHYLGMRTYTVHVLHVHVKNKGEIKTAYELLDSQGDERFSVQLGVKGHKTYLWEGYNADGSVGMNAGSRQRYQVPRNVLNDDPAFASLYSLADSLIGTPYVWGGTDTDGFDCSGFVYYVYNHSGYASMPRYTAQDLFHHCEVVTADEIKPGDLVFLTGTGSSGNTVTHVCIFLGNNMVVNCGDPVKYCNITTGWWKRHFYAYGRYTG